MHIPDLVVVRRRQDYQLPKAARRANMKQSQWTLHRGDCPYLRRVTESQMMPAPAQAYPGTVACKTCKPGTQEAPSDGNR